MDETTPVDPELAAMVEAMHAEAVARGAVVDDGEGTKRAKATQGTVGRGDLPAVGPVKRDWLRSWEMDRE